MTVGITQRDLPPTEFGESRYALDVRWSAFLDACGAAAVPLPGDSELALRAVEHFRPDGVVLSGGDDLAPYGGRVPHRDRTEERLVRWALSADIPVLGVCRGMQVLLHFFGTRLRPVPGHVAVRHEIASRDGERREVNSYHRFGATAVADPLVVDALCGDVVEQVHHRDARVVGIMWHPEREPRFAPTDIALVRDLLGAGR
jgi:N5-(cytidine 5'-diphosphoramidyl)-L-glutamine hydrolase